MISKIIFIAIMIARSTSRQDISSDVLAVLKPFNLSEFLNLFDGPSRISHARTTPTTNSVPSRKQMEYYNYYAASMYCQYQLNNLSCTYCQKFINDVDGHTVLTNNNLDTAALVTHSNKRKEIVVTCRGTQNLWNVVQDFATIAVKYKGIPRGIRIHVGFCSCTMSLYNQIVANVGYLRTHFPQYKIVIVGHSLGGAMARLTIFFLLCLKQFPGATYELFTYGEPRSGNQAFANYMNSQNITVARVVSRADIVPNVAPTSVLGTRLLGDYYLHCQTEYWINGDDNQRFCNQFVYEDPTCSDSLGPIYNLVDHGLYFDADYATCIIGQPVPWLALPGFPQPFGVALPGPIYEFLGAATNFALEDVLEPIVGR